jgi:NhaA family Na+:H+ antiporter
VLALLGKRVPPALKVFLATLAIVDDLGAVLVIALFYTDAIAWRFLDGGLLLLAISCGLNRIGVRSTWPYAALGIGIWLLFLKSGVHATIAGVALAMTVPARRRLDEKVFSSRGRQLLDEFDRVADQTPHTNAEQLEVVHELARHCSDVQAPLQRMEHGLEPFIAFLIVPLFALSNAGVSVVDGFGSNLHAAAAQGVFAGLLLGKPLGVYGATWLAARLLRSGLPEGLGWRHVHGAAWLAGIGFTMSLFVNSLALAAQPATLDAAKIAVLAASLACGAVGSVVLWRAGRPQ